MDKLRCGLTYAKLAPHLSRERLLYGLTYLSRERLLYGLTYPKLAPHIYIK